MSLKAMTQPARRRIASIMALALACLACVACVACGDRKGRVGAGAGGVSVSGPRRAAPALAEGERWNLLLVTLDTCRADVLRRLGGTRDVAPHLERLAADGALFTAAETVTPLTLPAHCSILTGLHPGGHGVRHNARYALAAEHVTLATALRREGWTTAAFVAAFPLAPEFGTNQGFDVYDASFERTRGVDSERPASAVNARAVPWLEQAHDGPFFAWVHYFDAHDPYVPPEPWRSRYADAPYLGEVAAVDAALGELLAALDRAGTREKTLVVVVGDHGEGLGEHGELFHGLLLHGATTHVPLVFWGGPLERGGSELSFPVSVADIMPTALSLLGVPVPDAVQGLDLAPWLRGAGRAASRTGAPDTSAAPMRLGAISETYYGWLEFGWSPLRAIRSTSHRYVEAPTPELYDLDADARELRNVAGKEAELAGRLRADLLAQEARTLHAEAGAGAAREMTQQELEALQSLGYVASGGGFALEPGSIPSGPDPKAMMSLHARYDEARALLDRGNPAGALPILDEVVAKDPQNLRFRGKRAAALAFLGRVQEADAEWRAMIRQDPRDFQAYWDLASLHELSGGTREAIAVLGQLHAAEPGYVGLTERIASLHALLGETDEALALLLKEGGSAGSDATPALAASATGERLAQAGRIALRAGRAASAVELFERALGAQPPGPVEPSILEAARAESRGDGAAAIAALKGEADRAPASVAAASALCHAALRLGDASDAQDALDAMGAETACRRLASLPGHEPVDQAALVSALLVAGRFDEARATSEALMQRNPRWWWIPRAWAEFHLARGDAESAVGALRVWLALDPGSATAKSEVERLQRLR